jgi:hypothetical protein
VDEHERFFHTYFASKREAEAKAQVMVRVRARVRAG